MSIEILFPLGFSFLIAYLFTPLIIKNAKRLQIVDDPKKTNHPKVIHTKPTPRGGGVVIFLSILIGSIVFLPIDKHLIGILAGALILALMGFLDDRYNLNPYLRLFLGLIASMAPVAAGIGISYITNPIGGMIDLSYPRFDFYLFGNNHSIWLLSDLFAIFWITFLMNAMNMGAKGIDGQLSGISVIAALTIAFFSLKFSGDITQWPVIILALITAGAYLGFLPWHVYPQKIMPGYGGGILAGYMLAVLSILSTAKVGILVVVLGVPLIDTLITIARRLLNGKSPVWGDREHLHHKLLDSGISKKWVALIYWILTAILGVFAYYLSTSYKIYAIILVTILIGILILWTNFIKSSK